MNPLSLSCNLSWSSSSCGFTSSLSVICSSDIAIIFLQSLPVVSEYSVIHWNSLRLQLIFIAGERTSNDGEGRWEWHQEMLRFGFELEFPARAPQLSMSDHVCSWKRLFLMTRPICNYWIPLVSVCLFINVFKLNWEIQPNGELSVCWWHACSQFILFNT